jgi:hypothetical protein
MQAEIFEKVAKVLFNSDVYDKILNGKLSHPKSISEIANIYSENKLVNYLKNDNVKNTLTQICNGIAEIIVTQSEKNSEKKGGAPIPNQRQPGRRMEGEALVLILYGGFLALSMIVLSSMGLDYLTQNNNNPNVFSFSVNNLTYKEALLINILSFIIGIVLLVICLHYYREYNRRNNLVIPAISSDSDEESQPIRLREVHRNNVRPTVDVEALFEKFRVTTREHHYIPEGPPPSLIICISPREVSQGEVSMQHVAINIPILELPSLNPAIPAWNPPSVRSVENMPIREENPNLDTNSPIPNTGRSLPSISSVVSLLHDKNTNRVPFQMDDITPRNSNRSLDNTSPPPPQDDLPAELLSSRTTDNTVMPQVSSIPTPRSVEDMNTAVRDRQMGISFPNQSEEVIGRARLPRFDTPEGSEISAEDLTSFLNEIVDSLGNSIGTGTGSTIGSDDGSIMTIDSTNIHRVFVFEDFQEVSDDEQLVNNITIATMFSQAVPLIEQMFRSSTDDLEIVEIDSGRESGGKRMRYRQSKTKKRSRKQKRTKRRGRNHRLRSRKNLRKTRK